MGDGDHYLSYAEARAIRYGTVSLSSSQVTDPQLDEMLDDIQVQENDILNPGSFEKVTDTMLVKGARKVMRDCVFDELKRIKLAAKNIREQQEGIIQYHPMLSNRQQAFLRNLKRNSRGSRVKVYDAITADEIY